MGANRGLAASESTASVGPNWLISRLGSAAEQFLADLAAGNRLTEDQRKLADHALDELVLHRGGELEAVVLEHLARHFLARNELSQGVRAALFASRLWSSASKLDRADLVLDHALDLSGPASPTTQDHRFQLVSAKASVLAYQRRASEVATLIRSELGAPNARYSLENQVLLLVQQASASHSDGDGVAARLLLAEAMSLTSDKDLQRRIQTTALGIALASANGAEMKELSAAIADLSDGTAPATDPSYDLQFSEVFGLLVDGQTAEADAKAEALYVQARRAHQHDVAVRAVYARVVVEHTSVGPSDRALALAEQTVWLARERGSLSVPLLPIVGLSSLYLDRAEPHLASATIGLIGDRVLSSVDQLDLTHLEARLALLLQRHEGLLERLQQSVDVASGLQASQYTGVHHLLLAETWRLHGNYEAALEESRRALHWLGDCPNQTWVREVVTESIRVQVAAGRFDSPDALITKLDGSTSAGAAYVELCRGLVEADPKKIRAAGDILERLNYRYESMRARLAAAEIDRVVDLVLRDQAEAAEIVWIVHAVDAIRATHARTTSHRGLPISARQADVLELMAGGWSNKEIAAQLFISDRTASTHVSAILRRLKCRNRAEAVAVWTAAAPGPD